MIQYNMVGIICEKWIVICCSPDKITGNQIFNKNSTFMSH